MRAAGNDRQELCRLYDRLQAAWRISLDMHSPDWERMHALHLRLADLERRGADGEQETNP
jgi:hypothetical protein